VKKGDTMNSGIYPGSFDPVTFGHIDIIKRAASVMDHLIVAVLKNNGKSPLFSVDERVNMLKAVTADMENVEIMSFSGLLVNFAREHGVKVIVRGLRAVTDFEYELLMAQTNRVMDGGIDTIFFSTDLEYSYLSSSIVREIASYGGDISKFVPASVEKMILDKFKKQ
jgi:pantetheine-phosphate adenylyltransferase